MAKCREIGIVGAGLMGRWHAHAAHRAGARVRFIADADAVKARKLSSTIGAEVVSWTELISDSSCSTLHICTPTDTHRELAIEALGHGRNLMIEKPLATSVFDTQDILDAAKQSGRVICPAHQFAYQRSVRKICDHMDQLGVLTSVELKFYSAGGITLTPNAFSQLGADILPHPGSILKRLFPELSLAQLQWRIASSLHGEWELTATHERVRIRIVIGLLSRPTMASLTVAGTNGAFEADLFHDFAIWREGKATRATKITQPFNSALNQFFSAAGNIAQRVWRHEPAYPGLIALVGEFYEACEGSRSPPISDTQIIDIAHFRDIFTQAADSTMRTENTGAYFEASST